jgi:hypothetical protein
LCRALRHCESSALELRRKREGEWEREKEGERVMEGEAEL